MNKAPKLADREINAQITFIDFGAHGFAQPPGQLDHILMVGAQIGQRYTAFQLGCVAAELLCQQFLQVFKSHSCIAPSHWQVFFNDTGQDGVRQAKIEQKPSKFIGCCL